MDTKDVGIVINQYTSMAETIQILRKYTNDPISRIQANIKNGDIVLSCTFFDDTAIRKVIIKCINELKKKKITVKIYEGEEEITLQLLKNWIGSCREFAVQTEAEVELEAGDVDMTRLEEYSCLWNGNEPGWVVLKDKYDYTIYNPRTQMVLHIEDEDLNNQLAAVMILNGCEVYDGKRKINKLLKEAQKNDL